MNMFRGPLKTCFGVMGVRSGGAIRCQLNNYKHFSVNNCMQRRIKNENYGLTELFDNDDFEESADNMKNSESQSVVNNFNNTMEQDMNFNHAFAGTTGQVFQELDYDSYGGTQDLNSHLNTDGDSTNSEEIAAMNGKASHILLKKYLSQDPVEQLCISKESIMVNLIKKGLKPECLFVGNEHDIDNIDSSLLDFPIHIGGRRLCSIISEKSVIGFFNYSEVKALANNVEAKIPITIISDFYSSNSFPAKLHMLAAEIGCEKLIFNADLSTLKKFKILSEIDMSLIKTEFMSDMENMFKGIGSDCKFLLLTNGLDPDETWDCSDFESKQHHLCDQEAWDKEKIVLVITKSKLIHNYINYVASVTSDVKYLNIPFGRKLSIKQTASIALYQLTKEYILRNSLPKKKAKRATRKKSE